MKFVLLWPQLEERKQWQDVLSKRGVSVLPASHDEEAWKLLELHGSTVDLAIVKREGESQTFPGIQLIEKAKRDPSQQDLPVLLISEQWGDSEFAKHQKTPQGANAYLKWPCEWTAVIETIEAIVGASLPQAPESGAEVPSGEIQLEAANSIFDSGEAPHQTMGSMSLDLPVLETPAEPSASYGEIDLSASISEASGEEQKLETAHSFAAEIAQSAPFEEPMAPSLDPSFAPDSAPSFEPLISESPRAVENSDMDPRVAARMPYLFRSTNKEIPEAIIPGTASQSLDVETMKQYLLLREQDVSALSSQLKRAREQFQGLEQLLAGEQAQVSELEQKNRYLEKQVQEYEREKTLALQGLQAELSQLQFKMKAQGDHGRLLEQQTKDAQREVEQIKERVRVDLRKIRVREKELESRLEIMKRDSEALIGARESRIIELKRKLDLLEFNMDLVQDQLQQEKDQSQLLRDRLEKAAQVVRVAGGLLDQKGANALAEAMLEPAAPVSMGEHRKVS